MRQTLRVGGRRFKSALAFEVLCRLCRGDGTQVLQSEATNFSDARFQFDFLCGSHCFAVSMIQSLPLRTSERFRQRRRITPTRSEVAGRVVSNGMGGHGRASRTGWGDAVEHDDQHITHQRGAHGHGSLVVRRYDVAASVLYICDGERREMRLGNAGGISRARAAPSQSIQLSERLRYNVCSRLIFSLCFLILPS